VSTLDRRKCDGDTQAYKTGGTRELEHLHKSRTASSQRAEEYAAEAPGQR